MNKERLIIAGIVGVVVLGLAGMGQNIALGKGGTTLIQQVTPDGKTVTCVQSMRGGIDCNWEGAR